MREGMTCDKHRCSADLPRGAEDGWIVVRDVGFDVGNVTTRVMSMSRS
jgi:hypothetical protein